ncbi:ornithine cyclodeaminase family protein [Pseudonocardia sp. GCM10023141]|uniref:ornithine cyclodeaminase family protein n=1 Tax=Pseudonocardia sp. GCM10023141 TaxID=3252653 RepID=UPI00361BD0FA
MTLLFSRDDVVELLPYKHLIEAVEAAHIGLATGDVTQPTRSVLTVPGAETVVLPMIAASPSSSIAVCKLLVDQPRDPAAPRQRSTIVAVDLDTGDCAAMLDGAAVTLVRTAAASAVATRALSRPDAHVLGILGAGRQAAAHLDAIAEVRDLTELVVWNRTSERAEPLLRKARDMGLETTILDDPRDVVARADILCTLTPSVDPLVYARDLHPGLHINAVGSPPRPQYRELASDVLAAARLVVDSAAVAAVESGAVAMALGDGSIDEHVPLVDLGAVLTGQAVGRSGDQQVTVFVSVGLGIQDLAAVSLILETARQQGRGHDITDRL